MAETAFRWAENKQMGLPAQAVGEVFDAIVRQKGRCTKADLLEAAAPEDSPIHAPNYWDWDNEVAGRKWRERQAGELIRVLRIEGAPHTPYAVHVEWQGPDDGPVLDEGYLDVSAAKSNIDTRLFIMREVLAQLEGIQRRYDVLSDELTGVQSDVERLRKVIPEKAKRRLRKVA